MRRTVDCSNKMKIFFICSIFLTPSLAQSLQAIPSANPVMGLLKQFSPVVQKLFSFIADTNSGANGLTAIMSKVDQIVTTLMPPPAVPNIRQDTWWGDENRLADESIRPFHIHFSDESGANGLTAIMSKVDQIVTTLMPPPAVPNIRQDTWWGDENRLADESIRPFHIHFSDEMINDLRTSVHCRRNFTPPVDGINNSYGMNSYFLTEMLDYWQSTYDFKGREAYLNRYPQFMTNVQGLDIHYLHVKPQATDKRVVPILLLHGSPLTLFEYNYVIDCLLTPRDTVDFVFEIIVPDLPGYGYSQPTSKPGLNGYQVGVIMKNLMRRLGHEQFLVHAGDVGSWVGTAMAIMYPEDIVGYHTNLAFSALPQTLVKYAIGQLYPPAVVKPELQDRMYPIAKQFRSLLENAGYLHMHATRPDTFGIGADATPAGLAAWILPLMMVGSEGREANNLAYDGNLDNNYDINDIVDSLTIYWDQHCMTTSARFYLEEIAAPDPLVRIFGRIPVRVPVAAIKFHDEIIYQPDSFIKDKYPNLVQSNYVPKGGHFAGFENPRELSESIWAAVPKFESFNAQKNPKRDISVISIHK